MQAVLSAERPQDSGYVELFQRDTLSAIWVTFDKVGFHRYPDAPDEVAYLRQEHRHVFKFRVSIQVEHDDRDVEFHMFKAFLEKLYAGGSLYVNHKSCEMLARELLVQVTSHYDCSNRVVSVEVSEDGECGATLISRPRSPMRVQEYEIERLKQTLQAGQDQLRTARAQAVRDKITPSVITGADPLATVAAVRQTNGGQEFR